MSDAYRAIREIDLASSQSDSVENLQVWVADLDGLEQHLHECWIASESMEH